MRTFLNLDYFKPAYDKYSKLVLIGLMTTVFWDVKVALGWVLGNVLFFLGLCLKNSYYDFILTMKEFDKGLFVLYYLASMVILLFAVGIGFVFPQIISPYACCVGYVGFKFYLIITNVLGGEVF